MSRVITIINHQESFDNTLVTLWTEATRVGPATPTGEVHVEVLAPDADIKESLDRMPQWCKDYVVEQEQKRRGGMKPPQSPAPVEMVPRERVRRALDLIRDLI